MVKLATIADLQAQLNELDEQEDTILADAEANHGGAFTDEHNEQLADIDKQREQIQANIKARETFEARRKERENQLAQRPVGSGRRSGSDSPVVVVKEPDFSADPKRGFSTPREFIQAVVRNGGRTPARADDNRLRYLAAAGSDEQGTYSDPYGGFLVPEAFSPNVQSIAAEADPLANLIRRLPMDGPSVTLLARTDKDHTSSVTGGLQWYRRAETDTISATRAKMEKVRFNANSAMGVNYQTEELLQDSPVAFSAFIASGFQEELGAFLMNERIYGTGSGEFEGLLNTPSLVTVAKEGSQTADTIVGENVLKMRKRIWRYGQSVWLTNHDTYEQLAQVHIAGTNSDVFLFNPDRGVDKPDTLLGRPVIFTEYVPTLGDKGDIWLINPMEYIEMTYQPLQSAESVHVRFLEHERTVKFFLRNDGRSLWRSALTPKKSSVTMSPFVTLAARA